jgi:hypothetical protein
MNDSRKTKAQLIDELKESRYVRTLLANEVVRLKISLACADKTIIKLTDEIEKLQEVSK